MDEHRRVWLEHYGHIPTGWHIHNERGQKMTSAEKAKERLQADKWRDAPRKMLLKAALQEIVEAGASVSGFVLKGEIDRLVEELSTAESRLLLRADIENFPEIIGVVMGKEIRQLKADLKSAKAEMKRHRREVANLRRELFKIETAARELMDETEMEFEGAASRAVRQFVMNDVDIEELKRIDGQVDVQSSVDAMKELGRQMKPVCDAMRKADLI